MTCIINEKTGRKTVEDEINSLLKFYAYDDAPIFLAELNFQEEENSDESLYLFGRLSNPKQQKRGMLRSAENSCKKCRQNFATFSPNAVLICRKWKDCQNSLFEQESGEIRAELLEDEEVAPHARSLYSALPCFGFPDSFILSALITNHCHKYQAISPSFASCHQFVVSYPNHRSLICFSAPSFPYPGYKLIALIFILLSIYAGVQATKSQMEPIIDKSSCLRASPLATTLYSAGISHLGGFLRDTCESKHSNPIQMSHVEKCNHDCIGCSWTYIGSG
ncbi:unnamed protein product [Caenorhabditis angaria]|uniref:Uncharacterized protein n=1 Tax=Caenorhabditis angaria TaxID=860376 RepID=A0A9P1I7K6_9PELO|nr:unnamed protein product [Caenorhabditis angaria]